MSSRHLPGGTLMFTLAVAGVCAAATSGRAEGVLHQLLRSKPRPPPLFDPAYGYFATQWAVWPTASPDAPPRTAAPATSPAGPGLTPTQPSSPYATTPATPEKNGKVPEEIPAP